MKTIERVFDETGINLNFTEGIVTARLEIRSNDFGDFERVLTLRWMEFCREIFGTAVETETDFKGKDTK